MNNTSQVQILRTADGSDTLYNPGYDQHYHSMFGAVQESLHVFIKTGMHYILEQLLQGSSDDRKLLNVLEIGFGTGLNALLCILEAESNRIKVNYTSLEAFPLDQSCWEKLNYPTLFGSLDYFRFFSRLHIVPWDKPEMISAFFTLHKVHCKLEDFIPDTGLYDLIFFDAFGPDAQPELWTEKIFNDLGKGMRPGGVFVTYSVKGTVVRGLKAAGFSIEKLPGPPGKRHILRAIKL